MYEQFVCNRRPEKAETNRTRFTVDGDRINYHSAIATPTEEMLVAKILFNSIISTKDAKFMTIDISNFYLIHHYLVQSLSRSNSATSQKRSSTNTNSGTRSHQTALSTSWTPTACTDYHKRDESPTNY